MNASELIDPSFSYRLIATLMHFLLQGCLVALLAVLGDCLLSRASASRRYALHVAALAIMVACVAVTFSQIEVPASVRALSVAPTTKATVAEPVTQSHVDVDPASIPSTATPAFVGLEPLLPDSPSRAVAVTPVERRIVWPERLAGDVDRWQQLQQWAPQITALYFVCCGLLLARLIRGTWVAHRLRRRAITVSDASLIAALQRQSQELGLRFLPRIAWCTEVSIPLVIGVLKPVILLPAAAATGLSPDQLQALITHELAHIRRYDLLVNLVQRVVESMLFFHPAVWFISRRISNERELACDELVLATGCERLRYADALVCMAELSSSLRSLGTSAPATSLAASGANSSEFKRRVLKVLSVPTASQLRPSRISLLVIVALIVGVTVSASRLRLNAFADTPPKSEEDSPRRAQDSPTGLVGLLPHGRKIELVGVAHAQVAGANGSRRKVEGWWLPSGATLDKEPFSKLSPMSIPASKQELREFAIRLETRPKELASPEQAKLTPMHGDVWFASLRGQQPTAMSWDESGFMQYQLAMGFETEQPNAFAFYYSDDLAVEAGGMTLDGKIEPNTDATARTKALLQFLEVAGIEKSATETVVKLTPFVHLWPTQVFVTAIKLDGERVPPANHGDSDRHVFEVPASVISSFQITLRPMTHRVVIENVALLPGQKTEPKLIVDVLDELFKVTFRKDGKTLGRIGEIRLSQLEEILKVMQHDLNSETGELIVDSHSEASSEEAEGIVAKLKAGGWKWPTIKVTPPTLIGGEPRKNTAVTQPQSKESKALFATWERAARANGNISGGTLGPLVRVMRNFVKNNPTHEGAPKFVELLKRIDVTRDWSRDEAVKLLDEVTAIYPSLPEWVEDEPRFTLGGDVVTGKPLPEELKDAPWGDAQPNGLRAAWLLEPLAAEHRLNTPLKSRVLFHNSGKNAVVFRALTWNQSAEHKARDAQGTEIEIFSVRWTTIPRAFVCRLAPGEFVEVIGAGIGVGENRDDEDWRDARADHRVGAWIHAKAGDHVTFLPDAVDCEGRGLPRSEDGDETVAPELWWLTFITDRLSLDAPLTAAAHERGRLLDRVVRDLFGNEPTADELMTFKNDAAPNALDSLAKRLAQRTAFETFSGYLNSGPTKFKVLPVDPDAAKTPRTAKGPGQYKLGGHVTFVVSRRPIGKRIANESHLAFSATDATKAAPREHHPVALPDDYDSWIAAWMRGGTVLWVAQKGADQKPVIRRFDFTNPASVQETAITEMKPSETLPQAILDVLAPRPEIPQENEKKVAGGPPELRVLRMPTVLLPDHWIMQAVGFDNDEKELVTASNQSFITIRRWDVVGMNLISEIKLQADKHGRAYRDGTLMFSGDRKRVIAATDAYVGIWETATGKLLMQLPIPKVGDNDAVRILSCRPDLSVIVGNLETNYSRTTLIFDAHTVVWDGNSGKMLRTLTLTGQNDLMAISLSSDGKRYATTNGSGANIWDTSTGERLLEVPNDNKVRKDDDPADIYSNYVWSVQLSPDGKQLAMGDTLGVKLIDTTSGKLLQQLEGPYRYSSGRSPSLVFSKDGERLARLGTGVKNTAGDEHHGYVVPIWSTRTGAKLFELHTQANDAAFSDDRQRLAVVFSDMQQALSVWNLAVAEVVRLPNAPQDGTLTSSATEKPAGPGPNSRQDRVEENGHYVGKTAAEYIDKFQPTWGDAKLGLQYGLALTKQQRQFRVGERVPLVAFFRNASDKPIKFDTQPDYFGNSPRVLNSMGELIKLENIPLLGYIPHYHETLEPGEALGPLYLSFGLGENPRPGKQHWHPLFKTPVAGSYKLTHTASINISGPKSDDPTKRDDITTSTIEFEIVEGDQSATSDQAVETPPEPAKDSPSPADIPAKPTAVRDAATKATDKEILAKELASFQGTWCFDVLQFRVWPEPIGIGTDSDGRKSEKRMVVKENQITWTDRTGELNVVSFTIDPVKTPKQIDFTFLKGPHRGQKSIGIYEPQKGNDAYRWLCMTNPGTDAPRPTDVSYSSLKQQSMIGMYQVAPPTRPSAAKALERFQGEWRMELCDSTLRTYGADQQEASKWQWTIKGDAILWSRQSDVWKLKLEIDPSTRPREMDLTYLSGPFQGEKCLGMYEFGGIDEQSLMIAIQDPGSKAPRPTQIAMSSSVETGLIFLRPSKPSDAERQLAAFQGTWTLRNFDTGKNNDKSSWPLPKGNGPDNSGEGSELRWVVKGNEITWTSHDGQEIKASFTFDPVKRPKEIDLKFLSGPNKGETCPGIYQRCDLDENILWLCLADPGSKAARPKSFSYQHGEGRSLLSFLLFEPQRSSQSRN